MEFDVFSAIWDFIVRIYEDYEPAIKVVSYVVSPILALLAFKWNRHDRREIIDKSTELGRLETEVENAHALAREEQEKLEAARDEIARRGAEIAELQDDLRKITDGADIVRCT